MPLTDLDLQLEKPVFLRMRWTETRMNAVRLEFTKRKSVFITLCKFISVDLYCKTFNHNMVINSQLFTNANQWDVTYLSAAKRITVLQFVSEINICTFWFGLMRWPIHDHYTVNSTILVANTSCKLTYLTKKQNNKPISLSQIPGNCSRTMGYRS